MLRQQIDLKDPNTLQELYNAVENLSAEELDTYYNLTLETIQEIEYNYNNNLYTMPQKQAAEEIFKDLHLVKERIEQAAELIKRQSHNMGGHGSIRPKNSIGNSLSSRSSGIQVVGGGAGHGSIRTVNKPSSLGGNNEQDNSQINSLGGSLKKTSPSKKPFETKELPKQDKPKNVPYSVCSIYPYILKDGVDTAINYRNNKKYRDLVGLTNADAHSVNKDESITLQNIYAKFPIKEDAYAYNVIEDVLAIVPQTLRVEEGKTLYDLINQNGSIGANSPELISIEKHIEHKALNYINDALVLFNKSVISEGLHEFKDVVTKLGCTDEADADYKVDKVGDVDNILSELKDVRSQELIKFQDNFKNTYYGKLENDGDDKNPTYCIVEKKAVIAGMPILEKDIEKLNSKMLNTPEAVSFDHYFVTNISHPTIYGVLKNIADAEKVSTIYIYGKNKIYNATILNDKIIIR